MVNRSDSSRKTPHHSEFHVVGVGASAGGLEAIEALFASMPVDTGAAFVVVQHLSPDFKSHMEELLARRTSIPIRRVTNEMPVEPDTIYLIPPNSEMVISNGHLLLTERDRDETLNLPIDHFFRSLATDRGRLAIGVILSGTGSDGSRGVVEIKKAGGLVLCQDEDSAKFDGMPVSAQATNAVHLVLPPDQIAHAISTYVEHSLSPDKLVEQELVPAVETGIDQIFKLLRREHNIDFSHYKPTTVKRRIDRRIAMGIHDDIEAYAESLEADPDELNLLYKDLLIGVTQFFRDNEAFEDLRNKIIPTILAKKRRNLESVRIWVAGCATGEEAYSLAILFHEVIANEPDPVDVKIFATDVHRKSLHFASQGIYPKDSFADFSTERMNRYFNEHPDGYEVVPEIRRMIVFAPHDVVNDAPFTRLDLVTCRNLLIYLQPVVQKKVISLFHFSLRTGGFMFLGPSETPGELSDEFAVENKKWRIYSKRRDVRLTTNIKIAPQTLARPYARPVIEGRSTPESHLLATYDALLDKTMPPSFLVDESGRLVHSFGGSERFLHFRGGRVTTNIIEVIHEDLRTSLAGALQHVVKEQKPVRYTGIRVSTKLGIEQVRLVVEPIEDPRTDMTHHLIQIEPLEIESDEEAGPVPLEVNLSELARDQIDSLENELRYTKENLQATVEELETSNEELQASNEELVASNEEMQSTNEELQSVNEELYTVNHEHQQKIAELTQLTDDMNNLFESTEVGVIFLDDQFRIRRFTPKVAEIFNLLPQDVGRSISNFSHKLQSTDVFEKLDLVTQNGKRVEQEVVDRHGQHWLIRVMPYQTAERIDGVLIVMVDISSVKAADADLTRYRNIVESTAEAIIGTDLDGTITSWNRGAELLYGYPITEAIGQTMTRLVPESHADSWHLAIRTAMSGESVRGHETRHVRKDGTTVDIVLAVSPVFDSHGQLTGLSYVCHDDTERRAVIEQTRKLSAITESTSDFVGMCDAEGNTISINPAGLAMLGLESNHAVKGKPVSFWHSPEQARFIVETALPEAIEHGNWKGNISIRSSEGRDIPLSAVIIAHTDADGNLEFASMVGRDISQQLALEAELRDRETFLRRTLDGLFSFAGVLLTDGTLIEANRTALASANLQPEDVLGKPFPETYWWSYSPVVQDQLRQAIQMARAGEEVRYDVRIRLAQDQFMIIDFQLTPLRNDQGEVTHLIPSGIDISDRIALEDKSRVFRRAFDSSLTAMVITDPTQEDNPIIYVNPGFEKLTGYAPEDAVGKNCRFLQGPETDPTAIDEIRQAIKKGNSIHQRILNYRKSGQQFWNELVITPVRNEQGALTHFVGVQFDMTEHRKAAERLSQARDMAEAANAAKSSFVANMSHEIRTPLTTILGMAEMLLEQETEKSKHDTLQLIYQSSKHLVTLVNDVLDMSKIEAGKLEADLVEVNPVSIINDVAASLSYRAGEKGLQFNLVYQGMIPEVIQTDPTRLRQVLFNLCGNSIKFTHKGSISLRVKLIDQDRTPKLKVDVADTGIGIRPAEIGRLFEKFSQVDESPTRKDGAGLGLYISRQIVEILGGSLSVDSTWGEGSCFTITIPTGDLSGVAMVDPTAQMKTQARRKQDPKTTELDAKILVAEDTRGIQVLLQRILENAGANVEVADDGQAALEMVVDSNGSSDSEFDLVVMDMQMPRLSGYDAAREIRKAGVEIPIIALTASALKGDRERCLDCGCNDYLTKPVDRKKLITKVVKLLDRD